MTISKALYTFNRIAFKIGMNEFKLSSITYENESVTGTSLVVGFLASSIFVSSYSITRTPSPALASKRS